MEIEDQQPLVRRRSSKQKIKLELKFERFTYLVIGYTLEVFVWNIFSNGWASKTSVYIFNFSDDISAIWFY
jgi:hypothetical protein